MTAAHPDPQGSPGPESWVAGPLARHQQRFDAAHGVVPDRPHAPWVQWPGYRGDRLVATHAGLVRGGATPVAAAKWLLGWFAGSVADAVGFTYALGGAGLLLRPAGTRWRLGDDGAPDHVHLGIATTIVPPGHPWSGLPGVDPAGDDDEVAARAVAALAEVCADVVVDVCALARLGSRAAWTEVADAVGMSLVHDRDVPVTDLAVRRLATLLASPAAPWHRSPTVWAAGGDPAVYVGRKAGCCLSYQGGATGDPVQDSCGTCSLRDAADCEREQLTWHRAT